MTVEENKTVSKDPEIIEGGSYIMIMNKTILQKTVTKKGPPI